MYVATGICRVDTGGTDRIEETQFGAHGVEAMLLIKAHYSGPHFG